MHDRLSDAKVPDPAPRGITVPAAALVVVAISGAIWGVGLFLLGRMTAPPVEVLDRTAAAHLASLNRIDQALVGGDQQEVVRQIAAATQTDDPIGRTALELRRARLTALAGEQAAKAEAATPAAVLRRLGEHLWSTPELAPPPPLPAPPAAQTPSSPTDPAPVPAVEPPAATLPEQRLGDEPFVPLALITHPTLDGCAYALHPQRGLLRSDDGGRTWRVGLEPLTALRGSGLAFTTGERPLLLVLGTPGWVFADRDDAFFP